METAPAFYRYARPPLLRRCLMELPPAPEPGLSLRAAPLLAVPRGADGTLRAGVGEAFLAHNRTLLRMLLPDGVSVRDYIISHIDSQQLDQALC